MQSFMHFRMSLSLQVFDPVQRHDDPTDRCPCQRLRGPRLTDGRLTRDLRRRDGAFYVFALSLSLSLSLGE